MTDDPVKRRNYRIEIPNIVDDSDMSPFTFRLYAHVKRVAGPCGSCDQGVRELARACKMSVGQVTKSKQELIDGGWVTSTRKPTRGGWIDSLMPVDLWEQNYATYARSEPVHDVNTNQDDEAESVHTVNESVHTVNERINMNKHDSHVASATRSRRTSSRKSKKEDDPTPIVVREAMADACQIELAIGTKPQLLELNTTCKDLWKHAQKQQVSAEALADRIRYAGHYISKHVWPFDGSNGAKPRPPRPTDVREHWRKAMEARSAKTNGTSQPKYYQPDDEARLSAEETAAQLRAARNGGAQ